MPRPHPPEFRRRAVELAREHAKPVAEIARDLGLSDVRAADDSQGKTGAGSPRPSFPLPT